MNDRLYKNSLDKFITKLENLKKDKTVLDLHVINNIHIDDNNTHFTKHPIIQIRVKPKTYWSLFSSNKGSNNLEFIEAAILKNLPDEDWPNHQHKSQKCYHIIFPNVNKALYGKYNDYNGILRLIGKSINGIDLFLTEDELIDELVKNRKKSKIIGQNSNKKGHDLEDGYAAIFNNKENVQIWNNTYENQTPSGNQSQSFNIFRDSLKKFGFNKKITSIVARTGDTGDEIQKLKGAGKKTGAAKTDVVIYINDPDKKRPLTISCKNSQNNSISGAHFSPEDYVNALNGIDEETKKDLTNLLYEIVDRGGATKIQNISSRRLTLLLNDNNEYIKKQFLKFALTGKGGRASENNQIPDFIFSSESGMNEYKILTMNEYTDIILNHISYKGSQFCCNFTFTVPHNNTDRKLQIKIPSLNNYTNHQINDFLKKNIDINKGK